MNKILVLQLVGHTVIDWHLVSNICNFNKFSKNQSNIEYLLTYLKLIKRPKTDKNESLSGIKFV